MHEAADVVRPFWVSVEGVNGVGKTYLTRALAARLGSDARLLSELTDGGGDSVSGAVIAALASRRSFLRTGHPRTETMALLALKVREHELIDALTDPPAIIIEDRGVDTVAVYQAAIIVDIAPDTEHHDLIGLDDAMRMIANRIYATAAAWRSLPDLTLLIVDDPVTCARRFATREGRPLADDEREIVNRAGQLYRWRTEVEPDRFRVVDRTVHDDPIPLLEKLVTNAARTRR